MFDSGTFSIDVGQKWAASTSSVLEDLNRAVEMIRRSSTQRFYKPIRRVQEVPVHWFPLPRVRYERERFSGGVNLSAQARNAARLAEALEARENIVWSFDGVAYCGPKAAARLREMIRESEKPPTVTEPIKYDLDISAAELLAQAPDLLKRHCEQAKARIELNIDKAFHFGSAVRVPPALRPQVIE